MNQIEAVMNSAKTSEGKARFADFEGASQMSELAKLRDYNDQHNDGKSEAVSKVDEENIDELSMSEIEEGKDAELSELEDGAGDILNAAFNDLKEGEISRQTYLNVLNGLKKFGEDVRRGYEDIGISQALYDYLHDDSDDAYDTSGKMTKPGITVATLLKAYDLHREGFEIKKYKTKGKQKIRYRVHNPEAAGISKPTKRSTKIYDKKYVNQQVKRGKSGDKIPIDYGQ